MMGAHPKDSDSERTVLSSCNSHLWRCLWYVFFEALVFRRSGLVLFIDALAATERARVSTLGKPLKIWSVFLRLSTMPISTYVINALLMEQVTTLRQASSCLLDLKVAQADQATVSSLQIHPLGVIFAFSLSSHYCHETF